MVARFLDISWLFFSAVECSVRWPALPIAPRFGGDGERGRLGVGDKQIHSSDQRRFRGTGELRVSRLALRLSLSELFFTGYWGVPCWAAGQLQGFRLWLTSSDPNRDCLTLWTCFFLFLKSVFCFVNIGNYMSDKTSIILSSSFKEGFDSYAAQRSLLNHLVWNERLRQNLRWFWWYFCS